MQIPASPQRQHVMGARGMSMEPAICQTSRWLCSENGGDGRDSLKCQVRMWRGSCHHGEAWVPEESLQPPAH